MRKVKSLHNIKDVNEEAKEAKEDKSDIKSVNSRRFSVNSRRTASINWNLNIANKISTV